MVRLGAVVDVNMGPVLVTADCIAGDCTLSSLMGLLGMLAAVVFGFLGCISSGAQNLQAQSMESVALSSAK